MKDVKNFDYDNVVGQESITRFDKKKIYEELKVKNKALNSELKDLEHKISLVKNNDLDYLDLLYREKFRYGTKDEIIIKLK